MKAIVLSRRDFREYDQIISFYTLEKGKVELLARGVKKITSKNSANLEPFSFVEIDLAIGKEIDHLTKVQPIEYFTGIRKDLQKSLSAGFVVSLMDRVVHVGERDVAIFSLLLEWLEFLNHKSKILNPKCLLDAFVVKWLGCLGFDITESENRLGLEMKKNLEILNSGDWEFICNLKFEVGEYKRVHDFVYKFAVYHLERKIVDWNKLLNNK